MTRPVSKIASYWYAYGYASEQAALDAMHDMLAAGDVSPGERPEVAPYKIKAGRRWGILLERY